MAFEKKVPDWQNAGTEPSEDLKQSGFTAGYKPPAAFFNWFWHSVSEALKELQANAVHATRKINGKSLSADVTLSASDVGADPAGTASTVQTNLNTHAGKKDNPHGVTAEQVRALPIGGGVLQGNLELKPYENGYSKLFKNHSADADYGTVLQDADKNGNTIKITLQASDGSFYFIDKDGNIYRVYGDHYAPTKVGTLSTDVNIKKTDADYASTFGQGTNNVLMRIHTIAGDETNKRTLALFDNSYRPEVVHALRLYDVVNGVETTYNIYGEHNVTAGTAAITAGTTELATGAYYDVYK